VTILQQAINLNLIDQAAAEDLAPEQRIRLIFLPGFSSRESNRDKAISVAENDTPLSQLRELAKRQNGAMSLQNRFGDYCQLSVRFSKP
jgi:hypothetical protein